MLELTLTPNGKHQFFQLYFRLNIWLASAQRTHLADSASCECGLIFGELNIAHWFPEARYVSTCCLKDLEHAALEED